MKRIYISLVALLLSLVGFSQPRSASSLIVDNRTNCVQYYYVFGDKYCKCGSLFTSSIFAIPPGAIHSFPSTGTLGGSFPAGSAEGIVGARIYHGPILCGPPLGTVGQSYCGLPLTYSYMTMTLSGTSCIPCAPATVVWTEAPACSDQARLTFMP